MKIVKNLQRNMWFTILAKQAVRYPLPEPTSNAEAPSVNLSLRISKACACYKNVKQKEFINSQAAKVKYAVMLTMWGALMVALYPVEKSKKHMVWKTYFSTNFHTFLQPFDNFWTDLLTEENLHRGSMWNKCHDQC